MMKHITFALLTILFLGSSAFGFADVTEFGASARPLGMGRAYLGRKADIAGLTLNPASIAGVDGFKFSSMSGTLMSEVGLLSVVAAYPTDFGDIGAAYISTSLAGLNITRITGGTVEVIGSTGFLNNALMLTYAPRLEDLLGLKGFRGAASVKLFNQGFSNQTGDLAGGTASGMDMDLGMQYDINRDITLGMSVLNALPVSMGGKITWQKGGVEEGIPAVMKIGGLGRISENLTLALGLDMSPQYKIPGAWHLGGEYAPFEYLAPLSTE